MNRLTHFRICPRSRSIRLALAESGIAVTLAEERPWEHRPQFLAMNPAGELPVLELDDGSHISESVAICRYFETLHPEPALMGADALERATIEMWERTADNDGMNAVAEFFRNSRKAFAGRGRST